MTIPKKTDFDESNMNKQPDEVPHGPGEHRNKNKPLSTAPFFKQSDGGKTN